MRRSNVGAARLMWLVGIRRGERPPSGRSVSQNGAAPTAPPKTARPQVGLAIRSPSTSARAAAYRRKPRRSPCHQRHLHETRVVMQYQTEIPRRVIYRPFKCRGGPLPGLRPYGRRTASTNDQCGQRRSSRPVRAQPARLADGDEQGVRAGGRTTASLPPPINNASGMSSAVARTSFSQPVAARHSYRGRCSQ